MADDQKVMLFNNDNKQGTVLYRNYNSRTQNKFRMIAIAEKPGEERQAVHRMNESGTLVVALSPYQERELKPHLHALVCGHGKQPGNPLYLNHDPGQKIGVVKVAKEGETKSKKSFDIGLVCMEDQQRDHHETSVILNGERIQLAAAKDALSPEDIVINQQVRLFNNANKQEQFASKTTTVKLRKSSE